MLPAARRRRAASRLGMLGCELLLKPTSLTESSSVAGPRSPAVQQASRQQKSTRTGIALSASCALGACTMRALSLHAAACRGSARRARVKLLAEIAGHLMVICQPCWRCRWSCVERWPGLASSGGQAVLLHNTATRPTALEDRAKARPRSLRQDVACLCFHRT